MGKKHYKVLVLDMQPIDPPVGGGRLRLLGLYHNLGPDMTTTYIGSYDWPGEKFRDQYVSERLREIVIPLSNAHFQEVEALKQSVGKKTIIDCTFHKFAHLSKNFLQKVRGEIGHAEIIFFSHPWVYPLVRDIIDIRSQLVVYDAQNVEGFLRAQLLDDGGVGTDIVQEVARIEYLICHESYLVLTCSHDDRVLFNKLYNIPFSKMRVVSNGVFTQNIIPASGAQRRKAKEEIKCSEKPTALFFASFYRPNIDAAKFICFELAPKCPAVVFLICGSVSEAVSNEDIERMHINNVHLTGFLSEEEKLHYLKAADIAINPVDSGSGTNIKMFDYFAAGLPVISTPIGARGIEPDNEMAFKVCPRDMFAENIQELISDSELHQKLGRSARRLVERKFSWELISGDLGNLIRRSYLEKNNKPFFSVIVPTYERHTKLSNLMMNLSRQRYKNFEVIIVDQSGEVWPDKEKSFSMDIFYVHVQTKGAVIARNIGGFYARGQVMAFTDDDCEPEENWLFNARKYFNKDDVIGIEGLIKSDKMGDPNYRSVSNVGFEGFGFMSANLMIKTEIFNRIDGFDERFDNPHFREDTDLAWRCIEYGKIPFARDVRVYHPPHERKTPRESLEERNKFFEKDALLMKKHPVKYKQLFFAEDHRLKPDFGRYLFRGAQKYDIEIPRWCREYLEQNTNFSKTGRADKLNN